MFLAFVSSFLVSLLLRRHFERDLEQGQAQNTPGLPFS